MKKHKVFVAVLLVAASLVVAAIAGAAPRGGSDGYGGWYGGRDSGRDLLVGANNGFGGSTLVVFNADRPDSVQTLQVIGLTAGDRVLGVDVRPATGTLYGQGYNGGASQNCVVQLNFDVKPPASTDRRASARSACATARPATSSAANSTRRSIESG